MANKFLKRLKNAMMGEPNKQEMMETKSPKKEPISLKRKLYRPSFEKKGREIIPTEEREYQDTSGIYKVEKKKHHALGVKGGK